MKFLSSAFLGSLSLSKLALLSSLAYAEGMPYRLGEVSSFHMVAEFAAPDVMRGYDTEIEFDAWKMKFFHKAIASGIKYSLLVEAFSNVSLNAKILRADRNQAEFTTPIGRYVSNVVSDKMLSKGKNIIAKNKDVISGISDKYGVPEAVLVAIWGIESRYGSYKGDYYVVEALANLSFDGRRSKWAEGQLLSLLRLIQSGKVDLKKVKGSWAGAMGHVQFIPSAVEAYAIDGDGDGEIDIWSDDFVDSLSSAANYLSKHGWVSSEPWGIEVDIPSDIDYSLLYQGFVKPTKFWVDLGVVAAGKADIPESEKASIIVPAGYKGPAFMIFNNFGVIRKYNNSTAYALAVGHLSDRISGKNPLIASWPSNSSGLSVADVKLIQSSLKKMGYEIGEVDGIAGSKTKAAIRLYQKDKKLVPDGHPNKKLLNVIIKDELTD